MSAAAPRSWLRDNGLTVALFALFAASQVGHVWAGWLSENHVLVEHGRAAQGVLAYVVSGAFLSSLFENWESEFLQMWVFVMLTACLFQRGSPESKDPDAPAEQDRDPALDMRKRNAPWPVRRGGLAMRLYSHSLGWALLALFLFSFVMHWIASTRDAAVEAVLHGEAAPGGLMAQIADPTFWFESFQNWQSEFMSTAVLIVLGIWLREKGSPESKAVGDPHAKTGG